MSSSTDITPPSPIEIMPFFDNGKYPEIDTSDLPKIGINTPNGIRYIPDQTKNPMLIDAIKRIEAIRIKYEKTDPNYFYRKDYRDAVNLHTRITNIHFHDILRLGCQEYIDPLCVISGLNYSSDCGTEHKFGSSQQSECEKENTQSTPRHLVGRMSCNINDAHHNRINSWQETLPITQRIENRLVFECREWRDK